MDAELRLELIALLAAREDWDVIVRIGQAILDETYPAGVFTGTSGDTGPDYIVALRNALARIKQDEP